MFLFIFNCSLQMTQKWSNWFYGWVVGSICRFFPSLCWYAAWIWLKSHRIDSILSFSLMVFTDIFSSLCLSAASKWSKSDQIDCWAFPWTSLPVFSCSLQMTKKWSHWSYVELLLISIYRYFFFLYIRSLQITQKWLDWFYVEFPLSQVYRYFFLLYVYPQVAND